MTFNRDAHFCPIEATASLQFPCCKLRSSKPKHETIPGIYSDKTVKILCTLELSTHCSTTPASWLDTKEETVETQTPRLEVLVFLYPLYFISATSSCLVSFSMLHVVYYTSFYFYIYIWRASLVVLSERLVHTLLIEANFQHILSMWIPVRMSEITEFRNYPQVPPLLLKPVSVDFPKGFLGSFKRAYTTRSALPLMIQTSPEPFWLPSSLASHRRHVSALASVQSPPPELPRKSCRGSSPKRHSSVGVGFVCGLVCSL